MSNIDIASGLTTGIISSVLFNPIDKVIYISTTKNLGLFNREVWSNLYKGSSITIMTRLITSGLYFSYIDYYTSKTNNNAAISLITAISCSITNPLQIVKFNSWYNNISSKQSYSIIKKIYGYKGFMIGIIPLIMKDFTFNYIYLSYKKKDEHLNNLIVISGALIAISPLNLIKNKKYASNESLKSIIKNFKVGQLGICCGILRIGLGFYISQYIYDNNKYYLNKILK